MKRRRPSRTKPLTLPQRAPSAPTTSTPDLLRAPVQKAGYNVLGSQVFTAQKANITVQFIFSPSSNLSRRHLTQRTNVVGNYQNYAQGLIPPLGNVKRWLTQVSLHPVNGGDTAQSQAGRRGVCTRQAGPDITYVPRLRKHFLAKMKI